MQKLRLPRLSNRWLLIVIISSAGWMVGCSNRESQPSLHSISVGAAESAIDAWAREAGLEPIEYAASIAWAITPDNAGPPEWWQKSQTRSFEKIVQSDRIVVMFFVFDDEVKSIARFKKKKEQKFGYPDMVSMESIDQNLGL